MLICRGQQKKNKPTIRERGRESERERENLGLFICLFNIQKQNQQKTRMKCKFCFYIVNQFSGYMTSTTQQQKQQKQQQQQQIKIPLKTPLISMGKIQTLSRIERKHVWKL